MFFSDEALIQTMSIKKHEPGVVPGQPPADVWIRKAMNEHIFSECLLIVIYKNLCLGLWQ